MQAPNLLAIVVANCVECTSERSLAGGYENLVNKQVLDATVSSLRFRGRLSAPGGRGVAAIPGLHRSCGAREPGARRAALLKEVGELPALRQNSAVGAGESLPAPENKVLE